MSPDDSGYSSPDGSIETLAEWSAWVPFLQALHSAPRRPGVYLAREGVEGPIVYVGSAGERQGGGKPQGIRGRLTRYASGKAIASGLGEAVFDRALADADWLGERMDELLQGKARRAAEWGKLAFVRAHLHVCWTETPDKKSAEALETACEGSFAADALWNRRRSVH